MLTLADLFNSSTDVEFEGATYKLRPASVEECGRYQRWLESEARASAARATDLPEEDRLVLLREANRDVATQLYAWGGELCVRSLQTPNGLAKLLSIVCGGQGMTYETARRFADARMLDVARLLLEAEAGDDPEKKAVVARLLASVGLPPSYLASGSPPSPTSTDPPPSPPSAGSPPAKSSKSSSSRRGTGKRAR